MTAQIQVSREEKKVLSLLGIVLVVLVVLLVLVNVVFNNIGFALQSSNQAEIAVLVPYKNKTPGKEILEAANLSADKASAEMKTAGKAQSIKIHVYETWDNPDTAAWAATMAFRNPNTVAVIGPFDTRQSIAVAEVLKGKELAMLTFDGLAPTISPNNPALDTIFHISLPYAEQVRLMTTFLHNQGWDNVFVTAEQTVYAQKVLETFNPTANKIIKVVGSANITSMPAQTIISQVKDLKPAALLYIGKPELATALLDEMNRLNVEIPLVGLDTLSESTFLSKYVGAASVYYASSLFNIKAAPSNEISAFYRTTLAGKMDAPFASETLEAVWFIYSALNSNQTGNGLRDRVWNGMNQSTSLEWNGELTGFTNHWRTPRQVFFYELTLEHPDPSLFLTMEQ